MKVASPETLARLLSRRLAERGDPARAITLEQLLDDVLDYAAVRSELGLAGKGEYDVAMLGLLTHRTLLQVDPAVAAAARLELENPEPGLGFSKTFGEHMLRLRSGSIAEELASEPAPATATEAEAEADTEVEGESPERAAAPGPEPAEFGTALELRAEAAPEATDTHAPETDVEVEPVPNREPVPTAEPPTPEVDEPRCWACSADLPIRAGVRYCPHCGTDQAARRCVACGERLEGRWRFCPRCGRGLEES